MKKLLLLLAAFTFSTVSHAGEIKAVTTGDIVKLGKLMHDWSKDSEITSIIKDSESSFSITVKTSDGKCSVAWTDDLFGEGTLRVIPGTVESVDCSK